MRRKSIYQLLKSFFLFICVFSLLSCGEPTLNTPSYDPVLAIDGCIENGKTPKIYLCYTNAFMGTFDSIDFENMVKFNVAAYIITQENDTIGLMRKIDSDHFPPFCYTTLPSELIGEAGKEYRLLIRKNGMPEVTAVTTIPLHAPIIEEINSVEFPKCDTLCTFYLSLNRKNAGEYFYVENKCTQESNFYPIKRPVLALDSEDTEFSTHALLYDEDGTNVWLPEELESKENQQENLFPTSLYSIKQEYVFQVSSIDKISYQVLNSMFTDSEMSVTPFYSITDLPVSNINNGVGRWTGMNTVTYRVKSAVGE